MQKSTRDRLATLSLVVATFLNPLGFDAVQLTMIRLTGSYWRANLSMYCLALFFFGLYFYLSRSNPLSPFCRAMPRRVRRGLMYTPDEKNPDQNKFKEIQGVPDGCGGRTDSRVDV